MSGVNEVCSLQSGFIALHRNEDEVLAQALVSMLDGFVQATGYEGFEPMKRRSLKRSVDELRAATDRFIDERNLGVEIEGHGELPGIAESLRLARDQTIEGSRWALDSARRIARRDRKDPDQPELGTGED